MTRKKFFKSLLTITGVGAVLGTIPLIKKFPSKLYKTDEIKQLNDNFYVVRIDPKDFSNKRVMEYCKIFNKNGWKGIVIPNTDNIDNVKTWGKVLPEDIKQGLIRVLNT